MTPRYTQFRHDNKSNSQKGFGLIETGIILVVIALAAASFFYVYKLYETEKANNRIALQLEEVRNALAEYVMQMPGEGKDMQGGRFPCPASPTAEPGDQDFGTELCPNTQAGTSRKGIRVVTGTGDRLVYIGAVPTRELGISSQLMNDAYGSRFVYAVSVDMTEPGAFASDQNFGAITVKDGAGVITDTADFILLSLGPDGAGAYTVKGNRSDTSCPDDEAEGQMPQGENCDFSDAVFREVAGGADVEGFDDRLSFHLIHRGYEGWWRGLSAGGRHITHNNPQNVAIGFQEGDPEPAEKLEVMNGNISASQDIKAGRDVMAEGNVVSTNDVIAANDISSENDILAANNVMAGNQIHGKSICDQAGQNCFSPGIIGGESEEISCPDGQYMTRISQGQAVCNDLPERVAGITCTGTSEYMIGINEDGTPQCALIGDPVQVNMSQHETSSADEGPWCHVFRTVDLPDKTVCALTKVHSGGLNSYCEVTYDEKKGWQLSAVDGAYWCGETQSCTATCFDVK